MYIEYENLTITVSNQAGRAYHHAEKFSFYEALGVTVLTIYFVLGFPSNILLVVHFIIEKTKYYPKRNSKRRSKRRSSFSAEERIILSKTKSDKNESIVGRKFRGSEIIEFERKLNINLNKAINEI
jgi:hypothetical protein